MILISGKISYNLSISILTSNSNHGVAEHPDGIERQGHEGDHLVPKESQDLAGEDGEGDAGHRAQGQRDPHEELGRPQVLQVPEEKCLHAAPEHSRRHEREEEGEDSRPADDTPDLFEYLLGGRLEVEVEFEE